MVVGVAATAADRAKEVIDTDLRLNPNRIDYISHIARNNVIIIIIVIAVVSTMTNKFLCSTRIAKITYASAHIYRARCHVNYK